MQLSMTVLRCPDKVPPETRTVSGGEFHVGRGPEVDWVLPDPDRLLSKRHFAVAFRGGVWHVADTSTNGTYLNTDPNALGKGATRALRDGDRLRLGAYEIEVRVVEQPAASGGGGFSAAMSPMRGHSASSPFDDPLGDHPFEPAAPPRPAFGEPVYRDLTPSTGARMPANFDPMAPDREEGHGGGFQGSSSLGASHADSSPFGGFGAGPMGGGSPAGGDLPDDFGALAPHQGSQAFGGGFKGPAQSDHASLMDGAFQPPPVVSHMPLGTGGGLSDDWDKALDDLASPGAAPLVPPAASPLASPAASPLAPPVSGQGTRPKAAGMPPSLEPFPPLADTPSLPLDLSLETQAPFMAPPPAAAPIVRPRVTRPPVPPAEAAAAPAADPFGAAPLDSPPRAVANPRIPEGISPFDEPVDRLSPMTASGIGFPQAAVPLATVPLAVAGAAAAGMAAASSSFSPMASTPVAPSLTATPMRAATGAPPSPAASTSVPLPARASRGGEEMLEAFFAGAGLTGAQPADPMAMMKGLGQAFRAVISGLRSVLIARATIKREFRIEQTMMSARANPLKFSANDDDALIALLGVGRRTDMTPAAAITDSLHDIQMHEVAVTRAMQAAVRAMMEELSPDKIRATTEQGGMTLLAAQRKARAWDTFETRHAATVQALTDNFDSVFGKAFALAYERALDELSTRDKR